MATVDKNFRIKNGLVVEGNIGTINGNNILTESSGDSYILNLVGGATLVKSVNGTYFSVDGSGNLDFQYSDFKSALTTDGFALISDITDAISTLNGQTGTDIADAISTAETYTDTAINNLTTSDIEEGSNLYFTTQRAIDAGDGVFDAYGAASSAQSAAQSYADGLASNYDAYGSAATAESNAKSYADTQITNLVDGAPDLLNTLNELAAAIGNDSNYASTLTTALGNKQDTLTAGEGIYIDGSNVITGRQQFGGGLKFVYNEAAIDRTAVDTWYDPAGAASTAESNANSYTDTAVGNIASAVSQIDGAAIAPESVTINSVAKQYATTITGAMISDGASTVMGLSASTYRTVKALVKAKNGVHTQVSEILLTLDTSNNVAITEYAMVGTNGSLGDVSAIYHASGNIFITFTPVYDNTDVMCYATALI